MRQRNYFMLLYIGSYRSSITPKNIYDETAARKTNKYPDVPVNVEI